MLVVDDEAEIRKMLKRLLKGRGYRVYEAEKGKAALRMVKEHSPDLIVLDAMLPEVHGFDIARRIKGSKRYGQIPIIMVSAVYRGWRYAEDLKQSCGVGRPWLFVNPSITSGTSVGTDNRNVRRGLQSCTR